MAQQCALHAKPESMFQHKGQQIAFHVTLANILMEQALLQARPVLHVKLEPILQQQQELPFAHFARRSPMLRRQAQLHALPVHQGQMLLQ
jgi:hypothetical protein